MSTLYIRFATQGPGPLQRVPLIERLVSRASAAARVADWRAEAFHAIAPASMPLPSIAAVALQVSRGAVPGAWVCVATPVHWVAGMSSVTMPEGGILDVDPVQAAQLAADFNRVFADAGVRLMVGRSATLLCVFDQVLDVAARDPEEAVGRDVFDWQPTGRDAPRLRQLMSEMEMWLFDHAVNRARAGRSLAPLTGLWLWGGGPMIASAPAVQGWTAGRDPLFGAFGAVTEFPSGGGGGVLVCAERPGSAGWPEVERRWFEPGLAQLRAGRIRRLELSAGDYRFSIDGGLYWRFWRRSRPWWESFGLESGESNGVQ